MSTRSGKQFKQQEPKAFFKNPFFYFGVMPFVLMGLLFFSSDSLAKLSDFKNSDAVFFNPFFKANSASASNGDLFVSQSKSTAVETPDLKIIQDDFVYGISVPRVLSTQTLGDVLGGPDETQNTRKDVTNYTVQPGDTPQSIAQNFNISLNTLLWANPGISRNSFLKAGQNLVILPFSGVIHIVRSGDTVSQIAQRYKAKIDDIITDNNLADQADIFVGDTLVIRDGVLPSRSAPSIAPETPLADSFFIPPAEGEITQGLHYYNAIDLANKCGTSIYAAAAGMVQRAIGNGKWNSGMGNYVTILHSNGVVTYYGHLLALLVKPGDQVNVGDRIGLMGRTGDATGCHVHFEVIGAKNPFEKYPVGTPIRYK